MSEASTAGHELLLGNHFCHETSTQLPFIKGANEWAFMIPVPVMIMNQMHVGCWK